MATASLEYNGCTILLEGADHWEEELEAGAQQLDLTMQRGAYLPSTLQGPRIVGVSGTLMSAEGDADAVRAQLEELAAALAVDEPKWLYLWTNRRIRAVAENFRHKYQDGLPHACDIQIDFKCPDPIWEDTAPTVLYDSGGASGDADTLLTFAVDYKGTAPSYPLLRFTMNHPANAVKDWTCYGPNLLTNTRFDQGESATQAGVPWAWDVNIGSGRAAYGAAGTRYGFTENQAQIAVETAGPQVICGLCQAVPLTEIGTVCSGQAEVNLTKVSGAGVHPVLARIEYLNAAGAVIVGTGGIVYSVPDYDWHTVKVENFAAPALTAYVRFVIEITIGLIPQGASVLIRNAALVRSATASFPGHFNNKVLDVSRAGQGGVWQWGEAFEVDNEGKTVRYHGGNEYVSAWPYFDNAARDSRQDFFQLDPSALPLHFSYLVDNSVRWALDYKERWWNA